MTMNNYQIPVTTTGSAGAATGTARMSITGFIEAIRVNYHGSAPATTTVDIDEDGGLGRKLMDLAAANTDAVIYPIVQNTDNTGAPVEAEYTRYLVPNTPVIVTVAASDALTNAVVLTITTNDH
jgi:hypothetical protein